jgi:hypothetical protein
MAALAVRLRRVDSPDRVPAEDVLAVRERLEVRRVHAAAMRAAITASARLGVVAGVIDVQPRGDRPDEQLVGDAVRGRVTVARSPDRSVAAGALRAEPRPALIGSALVDLGPEAF